MIVFKVCTLFLIVCFALSSNAGPVKYGKLASSFSNWDSIKDKMLGYLKSLNSPDNDTLTTEAAMTTQENAHDTTPLLNDKTLPADDDTTSPVDDNDTITLPADDDDTNPPDDEVTLPTNYKKTVPSADDGSSSTDDESPPADDETPSADNGPQNFMDGNDITRSLANVISYAMNDTQQENTDDSQELNEISWDKLQQIQKQTEEMIQREIQWDTWDEFLTNEKFNNMPQQEITDKGVIKEIDENDLNGTPNDKYDEFVKSNAKQDAENKWKIINMKNQQFQDTLNMMTI